MSSQKVYVIDDDPGVLQSTAFLLQSLGLVCHIFNDPNEFLAQLDTLEPAPVLTDLRMPAMDGIQLRRTLAASSNDWPVVLMTSETGEFTHRHTLAEGFAGLLSKPFTAESLIAVLSGCLGRKLDGRSPGGDQS